MPERLILIHTTDDKVDELSALVGIHATVWGVYSVPPKRKTCVGCVRAAGWSRGFKFGWLVCGQCKRPHPTWRTGYGSRLLQALGVNLIPVSQLPEEMTPPQGWGVSEPTEPAADPARPEDSPRE